MATAAKRSDFMGWYNKLTDWSVEDLFARQRAPGPPRSIFVNEPLPDDYYDKKHRVLKQHKYTTNQVITSKYTIITFLPRNLLEQFRRVANIFFLAIAILQFFNKFNTISPGLVILPLLVVWGITALKDGYEDIKRHQSDRRVNYSEISVLEGGGWENPNKMSSKSKTFVRGLPRPLRRRKRKMVKKSDGRDADAEMAAHGAPPEAVSRDVEYVTSDEPDVEYDNAGVPSDAAHWKVKTWEDLRVGDIVKVRDGQAIPADIMICATSEDENVAFVETKNLDGETNLKSRNAVSVLTHMRTAADCANPSNAFEIDCDRPEPFMHKLNAAVVIGDERSSVELQNTMLRGTVLKNTAWVIGIVMYTGLDTKLVLNSGGTPSKRSKVERQMNPMVFANLILLAVMAVACAIVDSVLEKHYFPRLAPWLFSDNHSDDNPSINGLVTFAFALITFQNIVPISLYISIEVVRTCQAAFIYFDREIYYEKTDQATLARSWNLSDDLGQIEYIFSDKTGTLTQNAMVFRRCSVGGIAYNGRDGEEGTESDQATLPADPNPHSMDTTVRVSEHSSPDSLPLKPFSSASLTKAKATPNPLQAHRVKLSGGVLQHYRDLALSNDVASALASGDRTERDRLNGFFSTLALCHTVLAGVDSKTGELEYKAQSPDEAALVQAAADVGWEFRGRDKDVLFLKTPFEQGFIRFRLLNILEFTSARKRMSVILRRLPGTIGGDSAEVDAESITVDGEKEKEDGPLLLLSKGADNVIFERLVPDAQQSLRETTEAQLDEFARSGLRTLTLAWKTVPEEEYKVWAKRYQTATAAIDDREGQIESVSDEIEGGLTLLGATAIEDRLQDGVPETIADLKRAGIKIWVATGDKLETAVAIGHSTNLIADDSNIIIIRGRGDEGRSIYAQMLYAADEYFPTSGILEDPNVDADEVGGGNGNASGRPSLSRRRSSRRYSGAFQLHRVNTGMSSVVGSNNGQRPGGYVLVIDGLALTDALGDDKHKHLLLSLAMQCEGVVCCRVSPKQKAQVVRLVKDGLGVMTLAIGDGANDVSMIQAADVGVGISGEEGLQAVNSSDYAIAQFRFLKRLLLVHGHWSYARNGNMILNFFYKNIICIGVLWWFQIYDGWSSAYVFEYTYLLFWNSFWTLLPVIAIGLFDRIVDDHVLMALPQLYRYGREGHWFGMKLFALFMGEGIVQSAIVFFLVLYAYFSPSSRTDGYDVAQYEFGTTMATAAVLAANLFNGLNTNVWTGWVFFAVFFGIVIEWAYTGIYSIISPGWFATPIYGNDHYLFHSALFWFSLPITVLIALAPRYIHLAWSFFVDPNDVDIMRWNFKLNPRLDIEQEAYIRSEANLDAVHEPIERTPSSSITPKTKPYDPEMANVSPYGASIPTHMRGSQIDMSTGIRSQSRGFDFATEEGGVEMRRIQSNLSGRSVPREGPRRKGSTLLKSLKRPLRRKKLSTAEEVVEA